MPTPDHDEIAAANAGWVEKICQLGLSGRQVHAEGRNFTFVYRGEITAVEEDRVIVEFQMPEEKEERIFLLDELKGVLPELLTKGQEVTTSTTVTFSAPVPPGEMTERDALAAEQEIREDEASWETDEKFFPVIRPQS